MTSPANLRGLAAGVAVAGVACILAPTMPTTHGQGNPDWSFEETILALDVLQRSNFKVPGKSSAEVTALSKLQRLPIHIGAVRNTRFRNADGVYLKLQNLFSLHPTRAGRGLSSSVMDKRVWDDYWQAPAEVRRLAKAFEAGAPEVSPEEVETYNDEDEAFPEGKMLTAIHKRRERRPELRARVLARARKNGLACEACGRGPALIGHGPEAEASIYEVHHVMPLAAVRPRDTRFRSRSAVRRVPSPHSPAHPD